MALDIRDWTEMYRMVHEYKADINAPSRYGSPPIWHEVSCGTFDAVQQLILMGARLDVVNHDTQQSLLDIAYIKNFNRTKHLLMAYNAKHYKTLYAKQLAVITEPQQATETETETKTSK
jgi:ankyrin repeat protein